MKKLKLNLLKSNSDVLTREQLKKVMGGDLNTGSHGSCVGQGAPCDTQRALICCGGMICVDWQCRYGPF